MAMMYIFLVVITLNGVITDTEGAMFTTLTECEKTRTEILDVMESSANRHNFRVSKCEAILLVTPTYGTKTSR